MANNCSNSLPYHCSPIRNLNNPVEQQFSHCWPTQQAPYDLCRQLVQEYSCLPVQRRHSAPQLCPKWPQPIRYIQQVPCSSLSFPIPKNCQQLAAECTSTCSPVCQGQLNYTAYCRTTNQKTPDYKKQWLDMCQPFLSEPEESESCIDSLSTSCSSSTVSDECDGPPEIRAIGLTGSENVVRTKKKQDLRQKFSTCGSLPKCTDAEQQVIINDLPTTIPRSKSIVSISVSSQINEQDLQVQYQIEPPLLNKSDGKKLSIGVTLEMNQPQIIPEQNITTLKQIILNQELPNVDIPLVELITKHSVAWLPNQIIQEQRIEQDISQRLNNPVDSVPFQIEPDEVPIAIQSLFIINPPLESRNEPISPITSPPIKTISPVMSMKTLTDPGCLTPPRCASPPKTPPKRNCCPISTSCEKDNQIMNKLIKSYLCPLCNEIFFHAVRMKGCPHAFCRYCLLNFVKDNEYCPICKRLYKGFCLLPEVDACIDCQFTNICKTFQKKRQTLIACRYFAEKDLCTKAAQRDIKKLSNMNNDDRWKENLLSQASRSKCNVEGILKLLKQSKEPQIQVETICKKLGDGTLQPGKNRIHQFLSIFPDSATKCERYYRHLKEKSRANSRSRTRSKKVRRRVCCPKNFPPAQGQESICNPIGEITLQPSPELFDPNTTRQDELDQRQQSSKELLDNTSQSTTPCKSLDESEKSCLTMCASRQNIFPSPTPIMSRQTSRFRLGQSTSRPKMKTQMTEFQPPNIGFPIPFYQVPYDPMLLPTSDCIVPKKRLRKPKKCNMMLPPLNQGYQQVQMGSPFGHMMSPMIPDFNDSIYGTSIQPRKVRKKQLNSGMPTTYFQATPSPYDFPPSFENYTNFPPQQIFCEHHNNMQFSPFHHQQQQAKLCDPHKYAFKWGGTNVCPPVCNNPYTPPLPQLACCKKPSRKFKQRICEDVAKQIKEMQMIEQAKFLEKAVKECEAERKKKKCPSRIHQRITSPSETNLQRNLNNRFFPS